MLTNLLETAKWEENAILAKNTLEMKPTKEIATAVNHLMDIPLMEEIGNVPKEIILKILIIPI